MLGSWNFDVVTSYVFKFTSLEFVLMHMHAYICTGWVLQFVFFFFHKEIGGFYREEQHSGMLFYSSATESNWNMEERYGAYILALQH